MIKELSDVLVKDSPTIGVASLTLAGVQLETWIIILAFIYGVLRLAKFVYDWYKEVKNARND